jgi:hypothetical protein
MSQVSDYVGRQDLEIAIQSLEIRLLKELHSLRNWTVGIILPLYGLLIALMFFLYSTKP